MSAPDAETYRRIVGGLPPDFILARRYCSASFRKYSLHAHPPAAFAPEIHVNQIARLDALGAAVKGVEAAHMNDALLEYRAAGIQMTRELRAEMVKFAQVEVALRKVEAGDPSPKVEGLPELSVSLSKVEARGAWNRLQPPSPAIKERLRDPFTVFEMHLPLKWFADRLITCRSFSTSPLPEGQSAPFAGRHNC